MCANVHPVVTELSKAMQAYRSGATKAAHERVDGLLKKYPNRADVLEMKGLITQGEGNLTAALNWNLESLKREPNRAGALTAAAELSLRLNRVPEAEQYSRRLVDLNPADPNACRLMAAVLFRLNQADQAKPWLDRVLTSDPNNSEALHLKAQLLIEDQLPGQAIEFYRKSIESRPSVGAVMELAEIYLRESHPELALDILLSAREVLPSSHQLSSNIAQAYTELQKFEFAEPYWSEAVAASPQAGEVMLRRAIAETSVGRFDQAERLVRSVIDSGGDFVKAFYLLSRAHRMQEADRTVIDRAVRLVDQGRLDPDRSSRLNFALGKSFDDLQDFERAIHHYDLANLTAYRNSPRRRTYNHQETTAFIDFQIQYFTPQRIAEQIAFGSDSRLPLFVVGMPRSGTTLVENILGSHSQIWAGGEQMFWTQRAREYLRWSPTGLLVDWDLIQKLRVEYTALIESESRGRTRVTDKNPNNIFLALFLHTIFPQAKILHMIRHPVDNLLSMWMTPMEDEVAYSSDRENLVFYYREYLRLQNHVTELLPHDQFKTVRYEDLTSTPTDTITDLLRFLDLELEPACLSPEKNLRAVLTPSVYQVRQPIHRGSQERWKNYEPWLGPFRELLS